MTLLDNALSRIGLARQHEVLTLKKKLDEVHYWLGETADAQRWSVPPSIIYANQADLYRLDPTLGTALDILSRDVGIANLNIMRLVGEDERDIPNHDIELLMRNPNPLETGLEFIRDTVCNYILNGNAVWWLNREDEYSEILEIWTIPFSQIQPVPDGRKYISHYNYFPGNGKESIPLPVYEIVHFKTYNPHNRFIGLSPIESLITTIQGDLGMRQTSTRMYTEYGGSPQSILAFKDFVPNESWADIKEEKRKAAMKNEMMMLRGVGDGVTWMSRAMSNKDAEFISLIKQNMADIFNRICPGLLSMLSENATEANALAARATYAEKTLWVMMETIAQKITKDICPAYGRKIIARYDDPRVVDRRLKLDEQAAFERTHIISEVRKEFYGDDPLGDDRDKLLVSQINSNSGDIQKPAPPMFLNQNQPQQKPKEKEREVEEEKPENEADETSVKAIVEDLKRWRQIALRGKTVKSQTFTSSVIPVKTMATLRVKVRNIKDKDLLAEVFDNAIRDAQKPQVSSAAILAGIVTGLKALEARRD